MNHPYADDDSVKIVVLHRRYSNPSEGEIDTLGQAAGFEVDAAIGGEWEVFWLWLYDHGETIYQIGETNPFTCPWDSGRVGFIALKKSDWGPELEKYAATIAEEYTEWANGGGSA